MDQLPALGKVVREVYGPTTKIYEPLLHKNAESIGSIKKESRPYGPSPRQYLDVYYPPQPKLVNGRHAVMIFLYGGGLINGQKTLPEFADGLCHGNIAAFFALNFGYSTIIPDYRLLSDDAKYPSGGEDLALVIEWVSQNSATFGPEPIDLFIMGNSAGGLHLATWLLGPSFAEERSKVLKGDGVRVKAVIFLSVPLSLEAFHGSRAEVFKTYFNDTAAEAPLGLLKSAQTKGPLDFVQAGVRVLLLNGEYDPEDEFLTPRDSFVKQWMQDESLASRASIAVDFMLGHNHISPFCALGTGLERDEAWGYQVGAFCSNIRTVGSR